MNRADPGARDWVLMTAREYLQRDTQPLHRGGPTDDVGSGEVTLPIDFLR